MSKTINNGIQAIYYYSKGIIEAGEDSLKLLLKSLGLAKKVQDKELIAKINIALGNNYFSRKNYYYAMALMRTDLDNTIFIGDQLFTDVYGANRTGLHSILVTPMNPKEEIQIVLKRYLEKIVLWQYRKKKH